MALKMVKGSIDRMFDKNLQDLVRGIRNHKEDEVSGSRAVPAPRRGAASCPREPAQARVLALEGGCRFGEGASRNQKEEGGTGVLGWRGGLGGGAGRC